MEKNITANRLYTRALAELLNSAIENICDIIHPQESKLVKAAKDKGSMAVLIALIANLFLLLALIIA